jgi:phosphomethylpyrimidine synthase
MTQVKLAKKGIVTKEMRVVARSEGVSVKYIQNGLADGTIVIPANPGHRNFEVKGIGKGLLTKVNANIGSSPDCASLNLELEKLKVAVKSGADTVMDLSTGGNINRIRRAIIKNSKIPVGTVPIYQSVCRAVSDRKPISKITPDEMFDVIEEQAKDGVDFMTLHCGVTVSSLESLKRKKRVCGIVSRGGAFLAEWIITNGRENPLYEQYDRLLDILCRYDVTISLGDGLRPGAVSDASDSAQIAELRILGKLVKRARDRNVGVIVEGPGHMPLDQIESHVRFAKKVCRGAPYYVLGPLVTDVAAGFDHIASAIGSAVASGAGVDFICYVTPSEHLRLPDVEDVYLGVIASRIAAHSGDIIKGVRKAWEWDKKFSQARKKFNWKKQSQLALDPEKFRIERKKSKSRNRDVCTMCGNYCAMKEISKYGI